MALRAACRGILNTSGKPPAWRPAEPARYASHAKYDLISLNIRLTFTTPPPHPPNRLPQLGTASPLRPPSLPLPSLDRGTPPLSPMCEHECKSGAHTEGCASPPERRQRRRRMRHRTADLPFGSPPVPPSSHQCDQRWKFHSFWRLV